ncbi:MAG: hypothetical protein J6A07_01450 [Firmicutes bacterium]|nr:hypothetical protein [Bacillota bacterium]
MTYEELLREMEEKDCRIHEMQFRSAAKGLCIDKDVFLSKSIDSNAEKKCILAEELGHIMTTYGNILDRSRPENQKQEMQARGYAYDLLIGFDGLLLAYLKHCRSIDEFVDFLDVTKPFFEDALEYYRRKNGKSTIYKGYVIVFDPSFDIMPVSETKTKEYGHIS